MSLRDSARSKLDLITAQTIFRNGTEIQNPNYEPEAHGIVKHFAEVMWRDSGSKGLPTEYWDAAKNLLVKHTIENIEAETTKGYVTPDEEFARHVYKSIFVLPRDIAARLLS